MTARTISHIGFSVPKDNFQAVVDWYLATLAPLNYEKIMDFGNVVGLGANKVPDFWIRTKDDASSPSGFHIAFNADNHETVDAFYQAALKAGGKDNGKPGLRTDYHPKYYAAFVYDPVGNNVEAVNIPIY